MRERLLDQAFCAGLVVAQLAGWAHLLASDGPLPPWWAWAPLLVASWLAADAASGLAHFAADNWGSPSTPLVGKTFIAPFRRHHHHPSELLEHDIFELNGNNCLLAALSVAWIPFMKVSAVSSPWMLLSLFVGLWVSLTNQIHAWAHQRRAPLIVRWLQASGILLSKQHHARHHAHFALATHDSPEAHAARDKLGASDNLLASQSQEAPQSRAAREAGSSGTAVGAQPPRPEAYCITSGAWERAWSSLQPAKSR